MSSILTNTSAMVALETLRMTNRNLESVQSEISTGKKVSNAKDNAAVWAISTVMSTDVQSFEQISDSLSKGSATVGVARAASEQTTTLLQDMKELIVQAQEDINSDDRARVQNDVAKLREQIGNIVNAAQFNGVNMVNGTDDVNVLASLDRDSAGVVSATNIAVNRNDLTTTAGVFGTGTSLNLNATASDTAVASAGNTANVTIATDADMSDNAVSVSIAGTTLSFGVGELSGDQDAAATTITGAINALGLEGISAVVDGTNTNQINITSTRAFEDVSLAATGATASATSIAERAETVDFSTAANVNDGDGYRVTIGSESFQYVAGKGETMADVAKGLQTAIDAGNVEGVTTQVVKDDSTGQYTLKVDNDGSGSASLSFSVVGNAGGEASGGLFGLDAIDVTTSEGAAAALNNVETLLGNSIAATASFGSAQRQLENQGEFVQKLTDSMKTGIGSMVDADLEAASARLQALQTQQQLGVQALSIANSSSQSLLSLFR